MDGGRARIDVFVTIGQGVGIARYLICLDIRCCRIDLPWRLGMDMKIPSHRIEVSAGRIWNDLRRCTDMRMVALGDGIVVQVGHGVSDVAWGLSDPVGYMCHCIDMDISYRRQNCAGDLGVDVLVSGHVIEMRSGDGGVHLRDVMWGDGR